MNAQELYEKARYLQMVEKKYNEALAVYDEIIEKYPNTQESYYSESAINDIKDSVGDIERFRRIKENEEKIKREKQVKEKAENMIVTTTHNIDEFKIKKYIDIDTVEIVIGTGVFSELTGEVSDFLGIRSTMFEEKLQKAKKIAFDKLKYIAAQKGGNAIVGVNIAYTEFTSNRIGLIVSGTIVQAESIN